MFLFLVLNFFNFCLLFKFILCFSFIIFFLIFFIFIIFIFYFFYSYFIVVLNCDTSGDVPKGIIAVVPVFFFKRGLCIFWVAFICLNLFIRFSALFLQLRMKYLLFMIFNLLSYRLKAICFIYRGKGGVKELCPICVVIVEEL